MAKDKPAVPVVNKYAAKATQDGVELTWNAERVGTLDPQDAADFYVESVDALQKFRKADPRTRPDLQAWEKAIKSTFKFIVGLIVAVFVIVLAIEYGANHGRTGLFDRTFGGGERRWSGSGWSDDRGW